MKDKWGVLGIHQRTTMVRTILLIAAVAVLSSHATASLRSSVTTTSGSTTQEMEVPSGVASTEENSQRRELQGGSFIINVDGTDEDVGGTIQSYARVQDTVGADPQFQLSGNTVTLFGNAWKAFVLPTPYTVTENTVLEFELTVPLAAEQHSICIDSQAGLAFNICFFLAGTKDFSRFDFPYGIFPKLIDRSARAYEIRPSQYVRDLNFDINVIALVSNNDASPSAGEASWSNMRIFEDTQPPDLMMEIDGSLQSIGFRGFPLSGLDRTGKEGRRFIVSADGKEILMEGNAFKSFSLPETFIVKESTILEVDLAIDTAAQGHAICLSVLDEDIDCFYLGGSSDFNRFDFQFGIFPNAIEEFTSSFSIELNHYTRRIDFPVDTISFISRHPEAPADGVSTMSDIKLFDDTRSRPVLKVKVAGKEIDTASRGEPYRESQDSTGRQKNRYRVAGNGSGVTFFGNVIKSFPIDSHKITKGTILQFDFLMETPAETHAICLDDNLVATRIICFHLGGRISFSRFDFSFGIYDPAIETVRRSFKIELNHFLDSVNFEVNVVAFSNNNEDRTIGEATFSNIRLYDDRVDRLKLQVSVAGQLVDSSARGRRYAGDADRIGKENTRYSILRKGKAISFFGNSQKSFPFSAHRVVEDTILEFDFTMVATGENHAICLDDNISGAKQLCFYLGGTAGYSRFNFAYGIFKNAVEGRKRRYKIELGHFLEGVNFEVNTLGFPNRDDSQPTFPESIFANIAIYDDGIARPNFKLEARGVLTDSVSRARSYRVDNDRRGIENTRYAISPNGTSITLFGNAWKSFPFQTYRVSSDTVLDFEFTIETLANDFAICLDDTLTSNLRHCFFLGGTDNFSQFDFQHESLVKGVLGESRRIQLRLGDFGIRTSNINTIAFIINADDNPAVGQCTFSNVRLYDGDTPPAASPQEGGDGDGGGDRDCADIEDQKFKPVFTAQRSCKLLAKKRQKKPKKADKICSNRDSTAAFTCPISCNLCSPGVAGCTEERGRKFFMPPMDDGRFCAFLRKQSEPVITQNCASATTGASEICLATCGCPK